MIKAGLSAVATVLTLVAFVPYLMEIWRRKARPHVFSWIIWGLTTLLAFAAQLAGHGGWGAWPIGISALISFGVAGLSYFRQGDVTVTAVDWAFLAAALSSLLAWHLTSDPLWTVVILTVVDLLGFGPTFRQVYHDPYSESSMFYALFTVRNVIAIAALERYSVTTILFPAAISVGCVGLLIVIAIRRNGMQK